MSFLRSRNSTFGATQQPWEVIVEVLETDVNGSPILWVGSDSKIYGYGDDGQIYDFTEEYYRAMNAKPAGIAANPYGGNIQPTGFNNTGFGSNTAPAVVVGNNNTNSVITTGSRVRMNNTSNDRNTATTTTTTTKKEQMITNNVVKGYKPRPGSELIPLYDPDTEEVEAIVYRDIKEFELRINKK